MRHEAGAMIRGLAATATVCVAGAALAEPLVSDLDWCVLPTHEGARAARMTPLPGSVSIPEIEPNDSFETAMDGQISHSVPNINVLGTLDGDERDYIDLDLVRGDVLGVALLSGDFDSQVIVLDPEERILVLNDWGLTSLYPESSTLPIKGWETDAAAAVVAPFTGTYTIIVEASIHDPSPSGTYNLQLRLRRNPLETAPAGQKHILYIDFDGELITPKQIFGIGNPATIFLSSLDAFLPSWGLAPADRDELIDAALARIESNMMFAASQNSLASYEIRNSRDHADPFGVEPNVTRCIVGGTQPQLGVATIGIAESIDPGNLVPSETAVVLLDALSDPNPGNPNSLNNWALAPGFTRAEAVGRALGNLVSHEIGHTLGCYHTDNLNPSTCLMDAGGGFFYLSFYQSGNDLILGNEDDNETNFIVDLYAGEGVGIAPVSREYTNVRVGFGLTGAPIPCSADMNDDSLVGGADLGGLLGAWMQPVFLSSDLDQDGSVSASDLGLLLAGWGQPGLTDLNSDGTTNGSDIGIFLSEFGSESTPEFDLNADGEVNGADLGILLSQWGACP